MPDKSLTCFPNGSSQSVIISDKGAIDTLLSRLGNLYRSTTHAGDQAAQYWADIAVNSKHPLAPLANIPGVFAVLWTPEIAPTTALTLGTAGYGFAALPKNMIHFTTAHGARGITQSGVINSSRFGMAGIFGPGVYMARTGLPLNGFIKAQATTPIHLLTPAGTVRIVPYLVYVRWGFGGVRIAP